MSVAPMVCRTMFSCTAMHFNLRIARAVEQGEDGLAEDRPTFDHTLLPIL